MAQMTLEQYQAVEQQVAVKEGRRGFWIHATVTAIVSVVLVLINVTAADEFPWAIFPIVGMSIGLWFHWHFGVAEAEELTRRHQHDIERTADAA